MIVAVVKTLTIKEREGLRRELLKGLKLGIMQMGRDGQGRRRAKIEF